MEAAEKLITENLEVWTSTVKAKSSAGRGSSNKRELYGIQKLRELILELAIRGLLAPQDTEDEPVSDALSRISSEKNRLVADGAIRKQKSSEISSDETPFKLPEGWQWVRLCEVAYPQAGFAFKSKNFNESELGLPLVRIRDVGQPFSGTFYDGDFREEFVIDNGDYLISMDGNFRVAPWDHGKALLNQRVSRLIFYGHEHSQKFCAISLQVRLSELQGVKAYTTVDHLSGKQISNSIIAFPPLAEQHRIVAKVDELMALCDQLEQEQESSLDNHDTLVATLLGALTTATADASQFAEAWQRIQANFDTLFTTESSIDQLKQTILQLAVMGKLVEQDAEDEPASELLKKLREEKKKLIEKKEAKDSGKLHQKAPESPAYSIPDNWEWVRFRELIWCFRGHNPPKSEFIYEPQDGYVRFVQITDFKTDKSAVYVPESRKNKMVYKDEIIMAAYRHIGKLSRKMEGAFNVALCKILEFQPMNRDFVELMIGTDVVKGELLRASERGHIPSMHSDHLLSLLVPLPPLAEQHRIVAKVDELMALCDQLKASLATAQTTKLNLADSLVEQAIA